MKTPSRNFGISSFFRAFALALIMVFAITAHAHADFQKGFDAYQTGDYQTALREFKKSADQGDAAAQYNLGLMYENGRGVAQDDKEAVAWYRRAAEQGFAEAQNNLGGMYNNGRGVLQDYHKAAKWYRRAAEQGFALAQFNLGLMYEKGRGVLQDYIRAHMWANIAAYNGNDLSIKLRELVETKMTPQQITKAQAMARECLDSQYKNC